MVERPDHAGEQTLPIRFSYWLFSQITGRLGGGMMRPTPRGRDELGRKLEDQQTCK
jgi:hypothetical protein